MSEKTALVGEHPLEDVPQRRQGLASSSLTSIQGLQGVAQIRGMMPREEQEGEGGLWEA